MYIIFFVRCCIIKRDFLVKLFNLKGKNYPKVTLKKNFGVPTTLNAKRHVPAQLNFHLNRTTQPNIEALFEVLKFYDFVKIFNCSAYYKTS